jgi:isoleucyl-tRNA synthetase
MAFPRHRPASPVPSNPSFPDIEKDVLASWNAGNTFAQSVEAREG